MNKKPPLSFVLGILTLLAAFSAGAQSAYFQAVTNLNPVGYWPMHEVEAAAPGDIETNYGSLGVLGSAYYPDWASANGNVIQHQVAGALVGDSDPAVHFTQGRLSGTADSFTNGLFISHTSPLTTLNPQFSVECWFYPTNSTTGVDIWAQNGEEGLNAGTEGAVGGAICGIRLVWVNSTFVVYGYDNQMSIATQNSNKLASEGVVEALSQWHHVVVTCDPNTNVILYVDGAQAASGADAGKYSPDFWTPLSIGSGLGNTRSIAGSVDEFVIYTNALAAADIQNHYNSGIDPTDYGSYVSNVLSDNPLIYLRMDAPAYTPPAVATWPVLTNFGSVAVNGVYTPGTIPGIVPGPFASGGITLPGLAVAGETNVAQLSGVSSFADAGYAAGYNPLGATPFSVTAMFRGNPGEGRLQTIIGHSANSWAINMTTTGKLQCQLGTNTTSAVTSAKVYNDGNWHQVVEVYTPASNPALTGTNALYVDGLLDTSVSTVTTNGVGPGASLDVMIGSDPQYTNNPSGVGRQFSGQVCEAAIFGQALSAYQVQELYGIVGVPPVITQQPISTSVNLGAAFTNTVVATGSVSSYQWFDNGVAISGQTNASLILNPVSSADAGTNYYVTLTNPYTSVTSALVSLIVDSAPVVVTQSSADQVFAGFNSTLFINASGPGTFSYQWTSNGIPIAGATSSSYTVVDAQVSATYGATVGNAYGTNSITPVTVTVLPPPVNPYPAAVLASRPMDYWRLDESSGAVGYDYAGGNNGVYTNTTLGFPGYTSQFYPQTDPSELSADFGYVATNNSYLGSIPSFVNFGAPTNTSAEFSVEAWIRPNGVQPSGAGIASLGYGNGGEQFCLDIYSATNFLRFFVRNAGRTVSTAQSSFVPTDGNWHHVVGVCDEQNSAVYLYVDGQLAASNAAPAGSGLLASTQSFIIGARQEGLGTPFDDQFIGQIDDVSLYNYALSSNVVQAHYYAAGIAPANFLVTPQNVVTNQNTTVTFTATATGTPPLSYIWTDGNNGNAIISTGPVLTLNNVQNSDSYQLLVSNAYGTVSSGVSVNIYSGPVSIVTDLSPLLIAPPPGYPVTLTVGVGGTAPFSYQWYLNATTPIPGATNNTYTFLPMAGTNTYNLWVTNQSGGAQTASSSTVTVEVSTTPMPISFQDEGSWYGNGKAVFTGDPAVLQLTDGNINEATSAYYYNPQYVEGFIATFTYTPFTGSTTIRADGTAFILQNAVNTTSAVGLDGGGLGYFGIKPSVAFEMDIFVNRPGGPGINVASNGITAAEGGLPNGSTGSVNINSGDPIGVTLYYNYSAGQLEAILVDQTTLAAYQTNYYVGDLGAVLGSDFAYVGFTSGSGGDGAIQTIGDFSYSYAQAPALSITPGAGGNVSVTWPGLTVTTNFVLQESSVVNGPWTNVTTPPTTPTVGNDQYQVTLSPSGSTQFYRLILTNP